jgi:hypothetical protein
MIPIIQHQQFQQYMFSSMTRSLSYKTQSKQIQNNWGKVGNRFAIALVMFSQQQPEYLPIPIAFLEEEKEVLWRNSMLGTILFVVCR